MENKNLLSLINSNKDHPFNFLKITNNDHSIIVKTATGPQERLIYTPKKKYLEALGREIFLNTYLREDKEYYIEEDSDNPDNQFRSDLSTKLLYSDGGKQNIIEFKELKHTVNLSDFKIEVDSAFSQIKNKYIVEKDGDIYCSVVIIDVEEIVNNPKKLELFITLSNKQKMEYKDINNFKTYGIYIITKKYCNHIKDFDKKEWFHVPKHFLIDVDEKYKDSFNIQQKVANIKDAIKFPTFSESEGISNVRDIKDSEKDVRKLNLLSDILETLIESFKTNNPDLINKYGKEKDIVFIKEETIIKSVKIRDQTFYSLTTMNGAVVDGQNSIDCFKIVLEHLENLSFLNLIENNKTSKRIDKILKSHKIISDDDRLKFKKFIEYSKISIRTTETDTAESAKNIAINKNNTMPVSKNELTISINSGAIQKISHSLLENSNIILNYPKKQYYGLSKEEIKNYSLGYEELAKAFSVYKEISKSTNDISGSEIFKYEAKLTKNKSDKEIKIFCDYFSEKIHSYDSSAIKKIDNSIKTINETLSELKIKKDFTKDLNCKGFEIDGYCLADIEEEIKEYENALKDLVDKKENQSILYFETVNTNELVNLSDLILKIKNFNFQNKLTVEEFKIMNLNSTTIFSLCFIMVIIKLREKDLSKKKISELLIEDICIKFIKNYIYMRSNYPSVGIVTLRNCKKETAKTFDINNNEKQIIKISDEMFSYD